MAKAFHVVTVVLVALLLPLFSARAEDLQEVSQKHLQRHLVPCQFIVQIGTTQALDEVVTCQDGRKWLLFWLENEVAFVDPRAREPYRWELNNYLAFPHRYGGTNRTSRD